MNLDLMIAMLEDKDTSQAFETLKELEQLSDKCDILYPYINKFIDMVGNEKYVIRVRGFRLFCKQAKWDTQNIVNDNLESTLIILNDHKPTAVRQALSALKDVAMYKKELAQIIKNRILAIDFSRYKDTMHGLISNDIQNILNVIDEA